MKINIFFTLTVCILACSVPSFSQIPTITKIELANTFPKNKIIVTGSGFSTNPTQLQVWFDQVKGTILTSTDFSIEVEVPAQARLSNVTVTNLLTRLSAQSKVKFMPVFSGVGFDATNLAAPISLPSVKAVFDIASADIDGDGKPDLIGTQFENTATLLTLLMNQSTIGNIAFTASSIPALNINAPTGHLAAGDLNGDGKPEIVASRSGTTANSVFVLGNTSIVGSPNFASPILLALEPTHFARQIAIQDLNGDGKPEIVVANSAANDLYIFKNESAGGTLAINPTPVRVPVTGASETLAIEIQDMDGDGKMDIIAMQNQRQDIFILKNTSTLSSFIFSGVTKIGIAGQFNDLATADFDKDGKLDIVATSVFSAQSIVLLNRSSSVFAFEAAIAMVTDTQPFGIDVSDLNGDSFPDYIVPCRGTNKLNVFIHNGNTAAVGFTKVIVNTAKANWFVKAGDLDGDAKPDIAFTSFTNPSTFTVDILRNKNCHKPQILNVPPVTICPSQTIRLKTIPIPGVTFDWNNGVASIKNSADPFADITAAATYTVTAAGEGGICSVTSAPLVIASGAGALPADPTVTSNSPICAGAALTLSTPAVSSATYKWTGPNNFASTAQNISIPSATNIHAGVYSLTVKVGDCSSNTVTKTVDVVSFGSFSVSSNTATNAVCQGQTVTLSVNSETGYTFQWIKDNVNVAGQTAATLNVTQEGAYKVRVTNTTLGCSQETAALAVTIFTPPTALFTAASNGCVSNPITFTSTSTFDSRATVVFAWAFGDTKTASTANATNSYTTAQTFNPQLTVSYSGVTGCTSTATKSINIVSGTIPTITTTLTEICPDEKSTLTVAGTFSSFLWNTTATTASIDVTTPGEYSVNTKDATGCGGTATVTVATKAVCGPIIAIELKVPLVFSPNGDGKNDRWEILDIENYGECTMNVFDGRGRKIFEKTGYPQSPDGWDGTYEGKEVPPGTYYFVLGCPTATPVTGSVLVVR